MIFECLKSSAGIKNIEIIAIGSSIRDIEWLRKTYGSGRRRKLKGFARIRFLDDGEEFDAEIHWYEAHGIGKVEMKIKELFDFKIMSDKPKFAICVKNDDYPASLQLWKVYRVLPDEKGAKRKMIRVVDESGEDYLFSASYFVSVELPQEAESALLALS